MKRIISCSLLILILIGITLSLTACGIDREDATEDMKDFFEELREGNYTKAERMLHPDNPHDLAAEFAELEEYYGTSINHIFRIDEDTSAKRVSYSEITDIPGTLYTREYDIPCTGVNKGNRLDVTISVLKNDNGYGIYGFAFRIYFDD